MKTQQVGSGIYNTAPYLLRNYGLSASESSPTKAVELQISQDGSVGNGMFVIARFPTRRQAINTLKAAGWNVYKSDCARFTEE